MMDARTKMLTATVSKLLRRGAEGNIRRILGKTHTADTAALLEALDPEERVAVFQMVKDVEQRAEIIAYLKAATQEELLSILDTGEVQEIVSHMDRDDAADLLGHLPEEVSKRILNAMVQEDSVEVEELMGYPEDSAGGLMSSEIFALNKEMSVREAVQKIQEEDEDLVAFYLYVVNEADQLVGVLSLKQLLLSKPSTLLKDIMSTDVISVSVETNQAEVARIVERYDFLSLPVVEENNRLAGVITVDDVIDVIREEAEEDFLAMGRTGGQDDTWLGHLRARLPWVFFAFTGGALCFLLILLVARYQGSGMEDNPWWRVAAFLPLILTVGATVSGQSSTYTVGAIRTGSLEGRAGRHLLAEFAISAVFGFVFGGVAWVAGLLFLRWGKLAALFGFALGIQIILSVILGSLIPMLMKRMGMDPTVASAPVLTAVADISAVTILFGASVIFLSA